VGYFGEKKSTAGGERAESHWTNNKNLPEKLFLNRKDGQGTTILSVAYFEPEEETGKSLSEMLNEMEQNIKKWFWPGISTFNGRPLLEIYLRHFENQKLISSKKVNTEGYEQFEQAMWSMANSKKLNDPSDIAQREITIAIPEKESKQDDKGNIIDVGHQPLEVNQEIKMIKYQDSSALMQKNSIALMRNRLCVVQYTDINFNESIDPAFGVLKAGLAKGSEKEDKYAHNFLRDAEPPLHDNWDYRDRLRIRYKKPYHQPLVKLEIDIDKSARDILQQKVNVSKTDFSHLSSSFKFGNTGKEDKPKKRDIAIKSHKLINDEWLLEVRIKNLNLSPDKDWATMFKCFYKVESGKREELEVKLSKVTYGAKVDSKNRSRVIAEKTIDEFDLSIKAKCSSSFTKKENQDLAIQLTAQPQDI